MDFSEVPLSPETLCRDVLDLCQEPGETGCVLLQSLADRERVVGEEENMLDLLQTFSPHREVHYSLRHTQTDDVTSSGAGEAQDEFVTERETVRRLREKAQLHETKLKQIRATRGAGESRRVHSVRSEEVQQISALFQLKQEELVVATATVQRLTNQLQSLRSRRFDGQFKAHLQRELQIRARNQDRGQGVPHHRDPELTERRLNQLRQKLRNRRNQRRNPVCPPGPSVPWGSGPDPGLLLQGLAQGPHLAAGSRVAAVGPYLESSCRPPESELKPPPRPAKTVPASEAPPPLPARTNHRNFNMDSPPPVPLRTNHSEDLQRRSNTPDRYLLIPQIGVVSAKHDSDAAVVPPPLPRKSSGSSFRSSTLPLPKHRTPPSAAVRPLTPDHDQAPPPILHRPPTVTAASIRSLYTSGGVGGAGGVTQYQPGHGTLPRSKPRAQSKPTGHRSDTEFGFGDYSESVSVAMHREEEVPRPRPLSPTKLLPFLSGGLRAGLLNAPRPLKKRSSLCEPESAPQLLRIRYQRTALDGQRTALTALDGQMTAQTVLDSQRTLVGGRTTKTTRAGQRTTLTTQDKEIDQTSTAKDGVDAVEETAEPKDLPLDLIKAESPKSPPPLPPRMPMNDSAHRQRQAPPTPTKKCHQNETSLQPPHSPTKILKSILRAPGSGRTTDVLRVWFNPVCLLLDSALEGEFDLVQRVIYEVPDPSVANDEGITALHNAVCAGHTDIVKFLVQFGVNVNAADSDGWTPLHCAASCNNTQVCKLLVESGAAVFACTHSDSQTPAEKCEEQEEGYAQCSQFLYGVQEKIGVMNRSQVFALWDFEPREADEIQIFEGDCLTVLDRDRSGDSLWWWVRAANKEGNVPRNLLGVYPRIKPRQRSLA